MSERHPFFVAFVMLVFAAIPGFGLFFLTDGAMWAGVLSGVLALPFGFIGGALCEWKGAA